MLGKPFTISVYQFPPHSGPSPDFLCQLCIFLSKDKSTAPPRRINSLSISVATPPKSHNPARIFKTIQLFHYV
ncbi:MAG: hypothetical protein K9J37_20560 [Saprospiraceae bacterium]|nr:hypothetical protein [Saprospiraceae bacterium]MCF8252318.1 hypothetical protein [Saprospiraceae bacterium]MCF8282151.1 hypothetical protein [Bacteroidales bacterium]MCF8313961.1 hypothetical protein [Saprospiraceae bacterium]MCF8442670.1 hypothetical protein [Saprospiraceae bacterium]